MSLLSINDLVILFVLVDEGFLKITKDFVFLVSSFFTDLTSGDFSLDGEGFLKLTNDLSSGKPGSFHKFDASGIYIRTGDKVIVITDLQFPNKNIISSKDAFNSYKNFFV